MEVQMRQFEQLQQMLQTKNVPVNLLKHVEYGNTLTKFVTGGGYMNHKSMADLCLMWRVVGKPSGDTVSSLMEYRSYTPEKPVIEPKKTTARKKKVALNG